MTFYHYVEECKRVDYRFFKQFSGRYTDFDGSESEKTYALYVRDIEKRTITHVDPMGEHLWEQNLYSGNRPKVGSGLRVIDAEQLFRATADVIDNGQAEGFLYITAEEAG